jgi:hypothetical protein
MNAHNQGDRIAPYSALEKRAVLELSQILQL